MPLASKSKLKRSSTSKSKRPSLHKRQSSAPKIAVHINVYDLLPPGPLASLLWPLGLSLLHTGIVLLDREYSYGATDSSASTSQTGIFHTPPLTAPPGGTHRLTHLQGFTYLSVPEIEQFLRDTSSKFPGERYNLLSNNCNHFTNYVCKALTGREMPTWMNRAAKVGTAMPCIVPREWAGTQADSEDHATKKVGGAYGTTADADSSGGEEDEDERVRILWHERRRPQQQYFDDPEEEHARNKQHADLELRQNGQVKTTVVRDTAGRGLPASEVAPQVRLT